MLEEEEIKEIDQDCVYTLALIGDSPVGKTTLFRKVNSGEFAEKRITTMGIDKSTIISNRIGNKTMDLALFDTSGEKKYRTMESITTLLKNSDAVIILYDITNKESFNNIDSWIIFANEYIQDKNTYTFFLMGTKNDLDNKREVSEEDAKEKCLKENLKWAGEISSKELDQDELKEKFNKFLTIIHNRRRNKKIQAPENKKKKGCCNCF